MPEPHTFLLFAAASIVLLVVPGPAVIYVVTRGAVHGRRAGVVSVLGGGARELHLRDRGSGGISALIASSATAFSIVKYAGAAYLGLGVTAALAEGRTDRS
jgi:threonine/homoserine/homoserine lactone efflux protein